MGAVLLGFWRTIWRTGVGARNLRSWATIGAAATITIARCYFSGLHERF
jgi:hypothetical protein